ncbi:PREDICTED: zinc finger protein 503-like [Branchiostoma belcheri]|uniref:Zinc finger protein 503-like n=1 Tax=Branchiostoma belcheri TaxID=7741 RepID=A0A6P4ZTR9_BRABE|nr:PREDICTED: zinc finger protein 503-like [Branchiostoma belcheri]
MNSVSPDQPPQIHFERPPTDPERQAKRLPIRIIRMLSARSQHMLRTEYLQPLQPTTLDAKKSPLALLAQTCSSIGKDTELPSKQASSSVEKDQRTSSSSPSKSSVVDGDKSSFKPYKKEEKTEGESSSKSGFHTPNSAAGSTAGDKTPAGSEHDPSERKTENTSTSTVTSSSTSSVGVSHSRINVSCGGMFVEVNHHETSSGGNSTEKSSLSVQPSHLSPSSPKPGHSSIAPHLPGALPCGAGCACGSGSSLLDPSKGAMTAQLPSTLPPSMAAGKLDASPLAGGTAPNPYAYVKTSTGATALMPICRDPYCTNCQGAQLAAAAGCKQCTHDTPYPSPFPYLPLGHPGLYSASTSMAGAPGLGTPLYSPYSTMLPHVCNWVSGTSSCGKRFATSEELLQHLRTHTMSGSQAGSLSIPSLTSSALNGCHLHYPSAASAAGLLRPGYPTSPVNGLHSYRYHPYKPPMPTGAPPSLAMPSLQLHAPTPGAFYSPYGLYAARLGAPTVGYP